jgi:hypothetical protein
MAMSGGLDPMALPVVPAAYGAINQDTKTLTLRATQTLSAAIPNLVLICAGQSNATNVAPSAYTPSNAAKLDQLSPIDGAIYAAADPLLGTSLNPTLGSGNPFLRLADSFATTLFDRVVLVPVAVDSTPVVDWETGFAKDRIPVAIRRLAARGIVIGTNVTIAVCWGQGEGDQIAGTSQAAYTASLNAVIAASRTAGLGTTGPWFVAKQTNVNGSTSAAVQAAQAAVVNHGAGVWAGPDADALVGAACSGVACRNVDGTHWSDAGSTSYAAAWKTAMALFGAPFA